MNNSHYQAYLDNTNPISRCLRQRYVVMVAVLALSISAVGCASIVRPNFETETIKLRAGNYKLDPDHTFILFRVDHLGLSKVIGRFNEAEATLDFDPKDIEGLQLDGRLATASIDLNNPSFENRLRGKDWFDTAQFPNATFITDSVLVGSDGDLTIGGQFTLRGVTRPMQLQAKFNGGADNILTGKYTVGFSASGVLSRRAYGIDKFGALVGDEIEIEIEAEFQRQ